MYIPEADLFGRLSDFLSRIFHVPEQDVLVWEESAMDDRRWEALSSSLVNCQLEAVHGDVAWHLSVYGLDSVTPQPTEEELSVDFAREFGVPVLFPSPTPFPSVCRLATPRGEVTNVRIIDPQTDEDPLVIADVEMPVPELPKAKVSRFPEIIKELRLPTPVTDSAAESLGLPAGGDPRDALRLLRAWEQLAVRMAEGWPPSGWYPPRMYAEDLGARDKLEALIPKLPEDEAAVVRGAMARVDERYRALTVEGSPEDVPQGAWYWRRRPDPVPWGEDGDGGY
nr:hypothetical protein [Streptomyces sp. SID5468]